jgi:hypothetical protein
MECALCAGCCDEACATQERACTFVFPCPIELAQGLRSRQPERRHTLALHDLVTQQKEYGAGEGQGPWGPACCCPLPQLPYDTSPQRSPGRQGHGTSQVLGPADLGGPAHGPIRTTKGGGRGGAR